MKTLQEIPTKLFVDEAVVLGSPDGVTLPPSLRSFPTPRSGIVVGRASQTLGDGTAVEGYDIMLDRPHPRTGERVHFVSDFMLTKGIVRRRRK